MKFISTYDSDSVENSDYGESSIQEDLELKIKAARKVYLVTYSQTDLNKFPTQLSFVRAVLCSFVETPITVVHCIGSREEHWESGSHHHMTLKLDRNQRWMSSKLLLEEEHLRPLLKHSPQPTSRHVREQSPSKPVEFTSPKDYRSQHGQHTWTQEVCLQLHRWRWRRR